MRKCIILSILSIIISCSGTNSFWRSLAGAKNKNGENCSDLLLILAEEDGKHLSPEFFLKKSKETQTHLDFDRLLFQAYEAQLTTDELVLLIQQSPYFQKFRREAKDVDYVAIFGLPAEKNARINVALKRIQNKVYRTVIEDIDERLFNLIQTFRLKPLRAPEVDRKELVKLGQQLFKEKLLSGPKNMTCQNCHRPDMGGADGLPLSVGEGSIDHATGREQGSGTILLRNSPSVTNLGYKEIDSLFWDGRVSFDEKTGTFSTPEPGLNGSSPTLKEITVSLKDPLSAQTIFPLLSKEEMKGSGNEIAQAKTNEEAWKLIMKRLMDVGGETYKKLFRAAYPEVVNDQFNIGHLGTALAAFMRKNFQVRSTPYDRYLAGDKNALTQQEKMGLEIFLTKGRCVVCHSGEHLASRSLFISVGVPHLSVEGNFVDDLGRGAVTGDPRDNYNFRVPPLRNVAMTAPYMHNGAFKTLDQVVRHYNNVKLSLETYQLDSYVQQFYKAKIVADKDPKRNQDRFNSVVMPILQRGLDLTEDEEKVLVKFLENSLTDDRQAKR